jgi:hypothetical protein
MPGFRLSLRIDLDKEKLFGSATNGISTSRWGDDCGGDAHILPR